MHINHRKSEGKVSKVKLTKTDSFNQTLRHSQKNDGEQKQSTD
jgi:hypothetical protein